MKKWNGTIFDDVYIINWIEHYVDKDHESNVLFNLIPKKTKSYT